jgi:transketolase
VLSRQVLPELRDTHPQPDPRLRVVHVGPEARPTEGIDVEFVDVEFLATGSEVGVAIAAATLLEASGLSCRVLSVLERDVLDGRERRAALTVSLEAGVTGGWHRFADLCVGIDRFGLCGSGEEVLRALGLSPDAVAAQVQERWSLLAVTSGT